MSIRSILAIARKDALDIVLNKATFILMLSPIFLAIIFVVIGTLLGSHTTNALIYDPGRSNVEQVIDRAFPDIKVTYVNSPNEVTTAFGPDGSSKSSSYALGLIVPDGFDASLQAGRHPQLGLYIDGSLVQTTSASGAFSGTISFIYIGPAFFVGPLAQLLGSGLITQLIKILPTYYIADGAANAILSMSTASQLALDGGITIASIAALLLLAVWTLRRQAAVVSVI